MRRCPLLSAPYKSHRLRSVLPGSSTCFLISATSSSSTVLVVSAYRVGRCVVGRPQETDCALLMCTYYKSVDDATYKSRWPAANRDVSSPGATTAIHSARRTGAVMYRESPLLYVLQLPAGPPSDLDGFQDKTETDKTVIRGQKCMKKRDFTVQAN